jgi:hypothetical protein
VTWTVDSTAPAQLALHKGARGRLVLTRIRYEGFERVDRLVPIVVLEEGSGPLDCECGEWLLQHPPQDRRAFKPPIQLNDALEDAIEELVFADQAAVASHEQPHFERSMEQIERYLDDQVMVLRRRLSVANDAMSTAVEQRNSALGSEVRSVAEDRVRKLQAEIEGLETQVERLQSRDDPEYERWRAHAHERRYRPPETTRILDVEFILK